jgi:hypothetical protein
MIAWWAPAWRRGESTITPFAKVTPKIAADGAFSLGMIADFHMGYLQSLSRNGRRNTVS